MPVSVRRELVGASRIFKCKRTGCASHTRFGHAQGVLPCIPHLETPSDNCLKVAGPHVLLSELVICTSVLDPGGACGVGPKTLTTRRCQLLSGPWPPMSSDTSATAADPHPPVVPPCHHTTETCVRRLPAAWGVTVCRSSLPFARECWLGVWFGCVGAALLPAVGTCVVLAFVAMPGR